MMGGGEKGNGQHTGVKSSRNLNQFPQPNRVNSPSIRKAAALVKLDIDVMSALYGCHRVKFDSSNNLIHFNWSIKF